MTRHQETARAILAAAIAGTLSLRGREGQFFDGLAFDANPISEEQAVWLGQREPCLAEQGGGQ